MIAVYKGQDELYNKWVTYGPIYFIKGKEYEIYLDFSNCNYSVIINIVDWGGQIIGKVPYNDDWEKYWEVIRP